MVDKTTRVLIARRAKEIIRLDPSAGKARVNWFLRAEFGVGLRSSTVLKLKAEVARENPELRFTLYARGSVKVSLRDAYNRLRGAGFLVWEAREFATQYKKSDFRSLPYIKKMVAWRRRYIRDLRGRGFSDREVNVRVVDAYRRNGWLTPEGLPNPWAMLRAFRKKDIESGEYVPEKRIFRTPTGEIRKIIISKGDVKEQKRRERERVRQRRAGDPEFDARWREQRRQQRQRAKAREEH